MPHLHFCEQDVTWSFYSVGVFLLLSCFSYFLSPYTLALLFALIYYFIATNSEAKVQGQEQMEKQER